MFTVTWFAWHMRRSTAAAVQHGLPLGNLILLVTPWKCLCLLLLDIGRPHTTEQAWNLLQSSGWETLGHLPYSPDFAPRNFRLFPAMQERLSEHGFTGDEDIKACYYRVADTARMDKLWPVPESWKGLRRRTAYPSQLHCALSVSSIIYAYCKLNFWSNFVQHFPCTLFPHYAVNSAGGFKQL